MSPEVLAKFRAQVANSNRTVTFTDLGRDAAGKPAFMLLKQLPQGRLAFGVISTDWLVEQQHSIRFGAQGHAVLLDAKGKVIGHPWQSWIDQEFDQSALPPVQAAARGETGVMQFRSSGTDEEMITAYAPVRETGWAVLVPQPLAELYDRAHDIEQASYLVTVAGMLAAAVLSWLLAKAISRPVGAVAAVATAVEQGQHSARAPAFGSTVAQELRQLAQSFNGMVDELSRKNDELANTAVSAQAASRAKSEFLANMSHELRTPLNAILGFSEVMRDGYFGALNQRYQSYARDIHEAATHLLTVIGDILDLSKAEAGMIKARLVPTRVPDLVDKALRLVEQRAEDAGVQLERDLDPGLYEQTVQTDPGKLTQILLNLLSNSVKFTPPGGSITVTGRLGPDTMAVEVRDTGIGIAAEDLETVMTPFGQVQSAFQARDGVGLGLPLSRKLAQSLGGQLHLASIVSVGTTATLLLPHCSLAPHRAA